MDEHDYKYEICFKIDKNRSPGMLHWACFTRKVSTVIFIGEG